MVGDIIFSDFVNTTKLCAEERSNGNKYLISSPEEPVREKEVGGFQSTAIEVMFVPP